MKRARKMDKKSEDDPCEDRLRKIVTQMDRYYMYIYIYIYIYYNTDT